MTWQKGQSGNPGGRTMSKANKTLTEMLRTFCTDKFDEFKTAFEALENDQKVAAYVKVASLVLPKNITLEGDVEHRTIQIEDAKVIEDKKVDETEDKKEEIIKENGRNSRLLGGADGRQDHANNSDI